MLSSQDEALYRVRDQSREVGTVQAAPEVDSTIALAGYSWRVLSVDEDARVIEARRVKGKADAQLEQYWTADPYANSAKDARDSLRAR